MGKAVLDRRRRKRRVGAGNAADVQPDSAASEYELLVRWPACAGAFFRDPLAQFGLAGRGFCVTDALA